MGHKDKGSKKSGGDDRRRDHRYDRNVPLRVGEGGPDGLRAESINISTRGIYCKVPQYVHPFSKLRVALDLPFVSRKGATVECDGVVVRVEPENETAGVDEYRLAIYFLNLDREAADLVECFLAESH